MRKGRVLLVALAFLFLGAVPASAVYIADISYYVTGGAGNYTFDFTVNNNSTGTDTGQLDFFLINFDADTDFSLYSNVSWVNDNGWTATTVPFDPGFGDIPAAVTADDSVLFGGTGGIAQGGSLSGFRVNFDYSGSLDPTAQLFTWHAEFGTNDSQGTDMGGYFTLGSADGTSHYVEPGTNPVPEPSTMMLLGAGLAGLLALQRRRKGQVQ